MSLEFIREAVKLNRFIGEYSAQTIVENDIIVPDIKPDINRIMLLDGDVHINSADTMQDKAMINGVIIYKILYISEDEEKSIKSINTYANFAYGADIPSARQGMKCKVKCEIDHIDHTIPNGRKINLKTILRISCKVVEELEKEVVSDFAGNDIEVLKANYSINSYVGSNRINYIIKEVLEVPSGKPDIYEILRNDTKISNKDIKITENKVIVKGDLNLSTLYSGDYEGKGIHLMEHEIPFSQFIDLEGINEDTLCSVDMQIVDSRIEAVEDSDGQLRGLELEVSLSISAEGYERKNLDLVIDAYSPKAIVNIEKQMLGFEDLKAQNKEQIVIKDVLNIPEEFPEISEVLNVLSKQYLTDCKVEDGLVIVEGFVENNVIYNAENSEYSVYCHRQETPFKQNFEITDLTKGMVCEPELYVEHSNYSMISTNEVEVRIVISVDIAIHGQSEAPIVISALENPVDEKKLAAQPGITIYFVQPDDTLWKIAKRYFTTMVEIQRENNLLGQEVLLTGQQLIIPKR